MGFIRERSSSSSPSLLPSPHHQPHAAGAARGARLQMGWVFIRHLSLWRARTHQSNPLSAEREGGLVLERFANRNMTLWKTCIFKPRRRRKAISASTSFIINTRRFTTRKEIVFKNKFVLGFYY